MLPICVSSAVCDVFRVILRDLWTGLSTCDLVFPCQVHLYGVFSMFILYIGFGTKEVESSYCSSKTIDYGTHNAQGQLQNVSNPVCYFIGD